MEWDVLLEDLENRFDAERRAGLAAESADLAEAEAGAVPLVDRLHGAVGRALHLRTRAGAQVDGVLLRVLGDVLVMDEEEGAQALVPLDRVAALRPLPGPAPRTEPVRPGLAGVLRALVREGLRVRLQLEGGEVVGRLVRVAADHVDVVTEAALRPGERVSVLLDAVDVVRSR